MPLVSSWEELWHENVNLWGCQKWISKISMDWNNFNCCRRHMESDYLETYLAIVMTTKIEDYQMICWWTVQLKCGFSIRSSTSDKVVFPGHFRWTCLSLQPCWLFKLDLLVSFKVLPTTIIYAFKRSNYKQTYTNVPWDSNWTNIWR